MVRIDKTSLEVNSKNRDDIQKLNAQHEKQIQDLRNRHNLGMDKIKQDQRIDMDDLRSINDKKLTEQLIEQEATLEKASKNLEDSKKQLENQALTFKLQNKDQVQEAELAHRDRVENLAERNREHMEEISNQSRDSLSKISNEKGITIFKQQQNASAEVNDLAQIQQSRMAERKREFEFLKNNRENEFKMVYGKQELENKNKVIQQRRAFDKEIQQMQENQVEQLKREEKKLNVALQEVKDSYQKKLTSIQSQYDQTLKNLDTLAQKEIASIKNAHTQEKDTVANKALDQFYSITELIPQIEDKPGEYHISIPVNKIERDQVSLNAFRRDLTLSLYRRFDDQTSKPDGTVNKSRRSEVITKDFSVPEIVDNTKVQKKYEDGILTFVVKKL